jgi:hypothetical protein
MSAPNRKPIIEDVPELADEFYQSPPASGSTRRLKPPPEIWELVHPIATSEFKPGRVLATRVANRNVLMVLAGLLILVGIAIAFWKLPIVRDVVAMLPKEDVTSKSRITKPSRLVQPESRSKVADTPNLENLNNSIPDTLPSSDVIQTTVTTARLVKQSKRKANRAIEKHSVAALETLPPPSAQFGLVRSRRSVGQTQIESTVKSRPKANTAPDINSASDSQQKAKPKVIPWP